MARGAAFLFGAGALLVSLTILLPHRHVELAGVLVTVGLAAVAAVMLLVRPKLLPPAAFRVLIAFGSVLVSSCIAFGGSAAGAYAFMFVWVGLYSAYFFTARGITAQMLFAGAVGLGGFQIQGHVPARQAQWLMALGVSVVAAILVAQLTARWRGQRRDLESAAAMAQGLDDPEEFADVICDALQRSTQADVTALLEPLADAEGLRVSGLRGTERTALLFTSVEARAALHRAFSDSRRVFISSDRARRRRLRRGGVIGLAQPVIRDGRAAGVLALAYERPRAWLPERAADAALVFAAQASVALERLERVHRDRERRALEINDNIVQGLAVAKYAIAHGLIDEGVKAIDQTLARARHLITAQLGDVAREDGQVRPGDLVREQASHLETL
jgi:GAF domain